MCTKIIFCFCLSLFVLAGVDSAFAKEDVEGSEDHPMISRYEGSYIRGYEQYAYDRLVLATDMEDGKIDETAFEGEVSRIHYVAPEGRSSLEVHRNYQMALRDAGFEIVYECVVGDDEKCGDLADFKINGVKFGELTYLGKDPYYFFARLSGSEGDILVSVNTVLRNAHPNTLLQIVEEKPMETGKVKVEIDAETMAKDIEEKGSARIYGIRFDADKATIKEKSESVLAEIAALLDREPDLRLAVVGHTSFTGSTEYSMDLSRQRAESVVKFLTSEHGISEKRLTPHGVGHLSPVASNEDEDARARNRRVELVKLPEER